MKYCLSSGHASSLNMLFKLFADLHTIPVCVSEYSVTYDCDSFLSETTPDYPKHVTDVIILVNCQIAEVPILFKVKKNTEI